MRLYKEQGEVCLLCMRSIDFTVKGEAVIDHDHNDGRIRGVLHRSCNAGEGRTANAAGRWGAKSMSYSDIIPWLENLVAYLKRTPTDLIYPTHKTADELRLQRNATERKRRAERKARTLVRATRATPKD